MRLRAKIWGDIHELAADLKQRRQLGYRIVVTSMPADPLHVGHLRCLQASIGFGLLTVIVNSDRFLVAKKGYAFMPLAERMEIVASLAGVYGVVSWDDGNQDVAMALEILRPHVFTKGGDRSRIEALARSEVKACRKIGCHIELGVGGADKPQSSSQLVLRAMDQLRLSQHL